MANGKPERSCGEKHLLLLGLIVGLVLMVCGATVAYAHTALNQIEQRTRAVEQAEAANAARFEAIQKALERLERNRTP